MSIIGKEGARAVMCGHRPSTLSTCTLNCPGPGSYTPQTIKAKAPAFKIGTEPRITNSTKTKTKETPGPATYNPLAKSFRESTPKWKYGLIIRE